MNLSTYLEKFRKIGFSYNESKVYITLAKLGSSKANVRKIPSKTESPVVTNIYKNKIAIIIWSEIPEAILIENAQAANAYRDYFDFMWKHGMKE
ncbi:hypothetical protein CMO92_02890 [Candidatus Woesearchaeota archaeon]|nr:hypothetical protein [Candidatus Woesearchaeota archaeon]|tara:strand:+ start:698 stop:979 length:282 start_codon:yes stop_codon:yes gene_type:complete